MVMLALDCAVKQWLNGSCGVRLMPQTGAGLLVNVFFEGLPERVAQLIRHAGARILDDDDLVADRTLA